jgi:hypothetical protein
VLERGDPAEIVGALVSAPITARELEARGVLDPGELGRGLEAVRSAGEYYFSESWFAELAARVRQRLVEHARTSPLDPGLSLAELLPNEPWSPAVLDLLEVDRRGAKAYVPGAAAALGDRSEAAAELEAELAREEIAKVDDKSLAAFLEEAGRLRRVGDGFAVSTELYDRGRELLASLDPITLPGFRDVLGVGRRTAQLLLERYDSDGITRRIGDTRVLRRAHP